MSKVTSVKEKYTKARAEIQKDFGLPNVMMIPQIEKVVINAGIGRIVKETDKVNEVYDTLTMITGQKPMKTKARQSIAGFKIREGQEVGVKVTLRGTRMWEFLTRLLGGTLPRVRDFQGITISSVDKSGNLNIGLRDHTVFPEVVAERVKHIFGLQITIVTSGQNQEMTESLFRKIGVPLQKEEVK